jgi:hypothetical protein
MRLIMEIPLAAEAKPGQRHSASQKGCERMYRCIPLS